MKRDFNSARRILIVLYLLIVLGIIVLFSTLIILEAGDTIEDPAVKTDTAIMLSHEDVRAIARDMHPEGIIAENEYEIENGKLYYTTSFTDDTEVKVNLLTGEAHVPNDEEDFFASLTDDFEEKVVGIGFVVFALSTLLCIYIANATLAPIAKNVEKQRRFISGAAHELRNPLTALHARIESTLLLGIQNIDKNFFSDLLNETKRLIATSEGLLALERGQYRKAESKPQHMKAVVELVLERLETYRNEQDIRIHTEIEDRPLMIDRENLETILYNLIHNALKFTKKHGVISVSWRESVLALQDNGIGIKAEDIAHIFEPFFKGDDSRDSEGNGLGLSLVKELIEKNGGSIEVVSKVGSGTVFTIRFARA